MKVFVFLQMKVPVFIANLFKLLSIHLNLSPLELPLVLLTPD